MTTPSVNNPNKAKHYLTERYRSPQRDQIGKAQESYRLRRIQQRIVAI